MQKIFYVYKITCLCDEWNGKFYIGSHYGYVDDNYTGKGILIKQYFKLYGKDKTYKKEILEISDNEIYIKDKEREIITIHINDNNNLNLVKNAAKSTVGKEPWNKGRQNIYTEEARVKMSKSSKGKLKSEEHKKHISEACKKLKNTLNYKWINNGIIRKYVNPNILNEYLENGWQLGYKI